MSKYKSLNALWRLSECRSTLIDEVAEDGGVMDLLAVGVAAHFEPDDLDAAITARIIDDHNACRSIIDPATTVPDLVAALQALADAHAQEFGTLHNPEPTCPELDRARDVLAKTGQVTGDDDE